MISFFWPFYGLQFFSAICRKLRYVFGICDSGYAIISGPVTDRQGGN